MISGYPKHIFFFPKKLYLTFPKTPLSLKKWIFKLLRSPCCWYSKRVSWDAGCSWKRISLIQSLSTEKTSEMCENISYFQQKSNQSKIRIFWHVLDVFSLMSNRINPIPFHERPASQDTRLEYQQQGNRSNLKIHFFRLRRVFREVKETFSGKKICFGYTEIIGDQMRYLLK